MKVDANAYKICVDFGSGQRSCGVNGGQILKMAHTWLWWLDTWSPITIPSMNFIKVLLFDIPCLQAIFSVWYPLTPCDLWRLSKSINIVSIGINLHTKFKRCRPLTFQENVLTSNRCILVVQRWRHAILARWQLPCGKLWFVIVNLFITLHAREWNIRLLICLDHFVDIVMLYNMRLQYMQTFFVC